MKLSVVIVNYNVKHFLEQCLHSVIKAGQGLDMEIFVVDNNSVDGSLSMLKEKFPSVQVIANTDNLGFSKANNQAIRQSTGEYVLLLNPDTVVEEDTFRKSLDFMDTHPDAGALGVKMLDGKGRFLPESKRGLPTPAVAFYKIFGLSALFPRSKKFGRYHLGYLDKDKTHAVDVLAGAYMLISRKALEQTGLLDEDFFMYGEDIDLSFRLTRAGYKNYYFPDTRIIHYKGESTKKSSVNYVFVFYNAMIIFARKHFTSKKASLFSSLIHIAIYLRAAVSLIRRFLNRVLLPLADAVMIYAGIYLIKLYWESNIIFPDGGTYPIEFIVIAVPLYILIWLFTVYISGGYDKPVRISKVLQGLALGTILILTVYGLLDESMRFSRALIIIGALWASVSMLVLRYLLHLLHIGNIRFGSGNNRRFVIAGDSAEVQRVSELLGKTYLNPGFIGLVDTSGLSNGDKSFIGHIGQLHEIIKIYEIDEVIFCSKSMSQQSIIDNMAALQQTNVDYKIAPPESLSIIGSNSINTGGELYVMNINSVSKPSNKRSKRLFDLSAGIAMLLLLPLMIFIVKNPSGFAGNIFKVLLGIRSWVGYCPYALNANVNLPLIRKGILNPADGIVKHDVPADIAESLNILYSKDYSVTSDVRIFLRNIRKLGRKV